jgi:hypothetical protein
VGFDQLKIHAALSQVAAGQTIEVVAGISGHRPTWHRVEYLSITPECTCRLKAPRSAQGHLWPSSRSKRYWPGWDNPPTAKLRRWNFA